MKSLRDFFAKKSLKKKTDKSKFEVRKTTKNSEQNKKIKKITKKVLTNKKYCAILTE